MTIVKKSCILAILLLICTMLLTGCFATTAQGLKGYGEMTPKERAGFAMRIYNNSADEYRWFLEARKQPDGTYDHEDRLFLDDYWKALSEAHRAIAMYDQWVKAGSAPTQAMEDELVMMIRMLSMLVERGDL